MTHLIETYGLGFLFLVIALESFGVPLPGETSLIAAGVLADRGHLNISAVIAVAAAAAIIGDNAGYWVGRTAGRRLIDRWPWLRRYAERVMPPAERFFARHGGKTVFFARFITGLRVTGAWMAGITHMPWWRFLFWNAFGGVVWATSVGLVSYYVGRAAADAISRYGLLAGAAILVLAALLFLGVHLWRRRALDADGEQA